ncbi:protein bride of sevenless [Homalodisca vitripennis]|nr:protein bride of sevenless [Homalodisca vitripennis]KAG8256657.1 hypothetical protein J6590_064184 [Homalodisca vitripennis]
MEGDNSLGPLTEAVQAPLFVQMAADILQVLNLFKTTLAAHCPPGNICDALHTVHQRATTRAVLRTPHLVTFILSVLQMESDDFDGYTVFHKIPDVTEFYEHFGSFKIIENKWTFVSENLNETTPNVCRSIPSVNVTGMDCTYCSNYDDIYQQYFDDLREYQTLRNMVEWRSESWVAAIASVSVVGVLCCIAIATFILIRICKRDILEGNPSFSFLLLLSIIFTYGSILPFSFQVVDDHHFYKGILCAARLFGTSLSYALLFSIMLARSLMLASCDQDGGFMSHINGYHQSILCFFIAAVQIGLSVQFWAVNWRFLPEDQCTPLTDGYLFILSLCYDMFLLILLVCTAPFILRSKRNYHEGGYFAGGSILCLLVWIGWVGGYVFFPKEYNDIFIVSGLCGTASVLLVIIFIPRTYLMMTGIVRDHLASALPSLAYQSSNSVVDVNYRSTQALYDSVNPVSVSRGQSNPNFYSDRPNTPSTSKMETIPHIRTISPLPDNTYERYGTPPSPLNVTRF